MARPRHSLKKLPLRSIRRDTALRGQRLWRVELEGTEAAATQAYFINTFGRLRSVVKVPGADDIWISTSNTTDDKLLRSEIR